MSSQNHWRMGPPLVTAQFSGKRLHSGGVEALLFRYSVRPSPPLELPACAGIDVARVDSAAGIIRRILAIGDVNTGPLAGHSTCTHQTTIPRPEPPAEVLIGVFVKTAKVHFGAGNRTNWDWVIILVEELSVPDEKDE